MEIATREVKGSLVIDIKGEVVFMDTQTFIDEARKSAEENPDSNVVFNFTDCPHLGTLGLGILQELHTKVTAAGKEFKILNLDDNGKFRLEEAGVEPPFVFIESEDQI